MNLTNNRNIRLSQAVYLAHDDYDYDPRPNTISATGLLKSVRQIALSKRADQANLSLDIANQVASSYGTAIHDAVEKAWSNDNYKKAMKKLGYPQAVIDRVRVNPKPEELTDDTLAIYVEQRSEREIGKWIVTGKYDFVSHEGELEDHKTTGVYSYMQKKNNDKYKYQGSIYRWLNPKVITSDKMFINFIFTDWSAIRLLAEKDKGYPEYRMLSIPIQLMSLSETQNFIETKIKDIEKALDTPEPDLPLCTKEELWQGESVYAYYKNPDSSRSTKNFDNFSEAQMQLMKDGSVGIIKIRKGMVKYCAWCNGASVCSQYQTLLAEGLIDGSN
jgi:hypothetical protein